MSTYEDFEIAYPDTDDTEEYEDWAFELRSGGTCADCRYCQMWEGVANLGMCVLSGALFSSANRSCEEWVEAHSI
jgi:hypothetical protein